MKKNKAKKIATWIVVPLMAAIFILDIVTVVLANKHAAQYEISVEDFSYSNGDDKIHFLNTANSDAILIESNGRFALVDSGEGNSNPRRKTEYQGFEDVVVNYLKKAAKANDGKVYLDFILATHCHYDHIGAFPAIISEEDIIIEKAYIKPYSADVGKDYESEDWLLGQTYNEIINGLASRKVEVVSSLPDKPFEFGDFTVEFYNTVTPESVVGKGENAASVGVKLTKGERVVFLAADITASTGLEKLLADSIGDVDVLKIGHHGYYGSSSASFLRKLKPEIAVVTNQLGKIYPNVKWNLTMVAGAATYATYDNNGLIFTIADDGGIFITNHIH